MESGKKFSSCLLVWITLSVALVCCAPDGGHGGAWIHTAQQLIKRGEMQYCGSRLVDAVRNLCQGNYAALTRRSDPALANLGAAYDDDGKMPLDKFLSSSSLNNEFAPVDFDGETWDGQDNSLTSTDLDLWPKNSKTVAMHIFTEGLGQHRVRRSLTDECCKRACGVRTMLRYCGGRN